MKPRTLSVVHVIFLASLAGCLTEDVGDDSLDPQEDQRFDPETGLYHEEHGGVRFQVAPGALSTATAISDPIELVLPERTLVLEGDRLLRDDQITLLPGEPKQFIPPPGATELVFGVNLEEAEFRFEDHPDPARFLDGGQVVDWLQHFADEFPNRQVSTSNYYAAGEWLEEQFRTFGIDDVVYDEFDSNELPQENCVSTGGVFQGNSEICPSSIANVVATQHGADEDAGIIVIGGHYDIVGDTTEGAYDNTGGALTVLALAQALAPYTFDQTIIYALWAGEETGLQGSKSWVAAHPELKADISVYWNYDVVGGSWPAPLVEPTKLHFQYGPDNPNPSEIDEDAPDQEPPDPLEEAMRDWAMRIVEQTAYPEDAFDYQGVVEDVSTSDHAAFTSEGIPVFNPNSSPEVNRVVRPHTQMDNLVVFSLYALQGVDTDAETVDWFDAEEEAAAKEALARSFDPYLWLFLHHVVMSDSEGFDPLE